MTSVMFLGLEHGLLAMAVGLITGSKTWATGVASAVAVGGYVLYAAGKFVDAVEPFQVASPIYHSLESGPVGGGFRPIFLLMPLVGMVALVVALPRFDRRDIGV
jgi:ABC-2 type transport system permease protein